MKLGRQHTQELECTECCSQCSRRRGRSFGAGKGLGRAGPGAGRAWGRACGAATPRGWAEEGELATQKQGERSGKRSLRTGGTPSC